MLDYLPFEQPIADIEQQIESLKKLPEPTAESMQKLRHLRKQLADTTRQIYDNLTPWQTVQVARHKNRPHTVDYLSLVFDEFVELHGDKFFRDDRAMRVGFAKLDGRKVLVVGHQKGRNFKDRTENFFGCAHPEGYRKSMSKMRLAAKYHLPIITFIDTPGAYPGIGAEERGQAYVIAENMFEMSRLKTPIVCIVIGEGGSGGALGIGVGDRVAMLQHAYYSVISPEGCAGILWKSGEHAEKAATALKFTSKYLKEFQIVDDVIEEPLGGAHRDHHQTAARIKSYLVKSMKELTACKIDEMLANRYSKFRQMGRYLESSLADEEQTNSTAQFNGAIG
ncbi:MAG TPA: acetyl-CoA carboxylase carboxyltransferase subunit alpha [Pirellulaceae bacterium]|nr:acetyl-CoA carboxylase carboxyltransferase subunit alpha [Pirellulaceae bacterium]HMO92838.1 acetyl-CoA carboxylase carboxyltransferase subunit alpha [Pirellulaceae bacterium]HMP69420.1 acetyl-CoA carboxylase carboxyltransferase subunit alpha [Pirellulaceae bacterium]